MMEERLNESRSMQVLPNQGREYLLLAKLVDQLVNLGAISAPERQLAAGAQDDDELAAAARLDLQHHAQVDDHGAVDAHKLYRRQRLFQRTDFFAHREHALLRVELDVVGRRLDPLDFGGPQENNFTAAAHHQTIAVGVNVTHQGKEFLVLFPAAVAVCLPGLELTFCPQHRIHETLLLKRLEEIVDRVRVKCLDRVLIKSGHEDDRGQMRLGDRFEYAEAVQFRHLHVEEYQVRLETRDLLHGVLAIPAFAEHFERRISLQQ